MSGNLESSNEPDSPENASGEVEVDRVDNGEHSRANAARPKSIWARFVDFERARLIWLRHHQWVVWIVVSFMVILVLYEIFKRVINSTYYELVFFFEPIWRFLDEHAVASIGIPLLLAYLVFGIGWIRKPLRAVFCTVHSQPWRVSI